MRVLVSLRALLMEHFRLSVGQASPIRFRSPILGDRKSFAVHKENSAAGDLNAICSSLHSTRLPGILIKRARASIESTKVGVRAAFTGESDLRDADFEHCVRTATREQRIIGRGGRGSDGLVYPEIDRIVGSSGVRSVQNAPP